MGRLWELSLAPCNYFSIHKSHLPPDIRAILVNGSGNRIRHKLVPPHRPGYHVKMLDGFLLVTDVGPCLGGFSLHGGFLDLIRLSPCEVNGVHAETSPDFP